MKVALAWSSYEPACSYNSIVTDQHNTKLHGSYAIINAIIHAIIRDVLNANRGLRPCSYSILVPCKMAMANIYYLPSTDKPSICKVESILSGLMYVE